jgi:hypothetical protein
LTVLLLKLLLVPGLVAAVTLAVRRWGPAVGGWLAGLPIVAGPVLVFYALEQGDAFAARAAHATLAGLIATVAFAVAYAQSSRRQPWYLCMVLGWLAFAAMLLLLYVAQPGLVSSLVVLVAATVLGRRAFRRVRYAEPGLRTPRNAEPGLRTPRNAEPGLRTPRNAEPGLRTQTYVGRVPPKADPPGDLIIRLVATATLVLVLTGLADRLGSTWSGLLNAFPVLTTIVAVFSHAQRGAAAAVAFLSGFLQAVVGFGLFCVVMALALESRGLGWALAAALAAQFAWHAILVSRTARSAPISGS